MPASPAMSAQVPGGASFHVEVVEPATASTRYRDAFRVADGSAYAVMMDPVGAETLAADTVLRWKTSVRSASACALAPDAILRSLNQELLGADLLATACCARFDGTESLLAIACAGAPPPWILRKSQRAVQAQASASIALGRLRTAQFVSRTVHFERGDTLLLASPSWGEVIEQTLLKSAPPIEGVADRLRSHPRQPADGCVLLFMPS
jgi:hypothetical protein